MPRRPLFLCRRIIWEILFGLEKHNQLLDRLYQFPICQVVSNHIFFASHSNKLRRLLRVEICLRLDRNATSLDYLA